MGLAACSGGEPRRATTLVPPAASPSEVQDAGDPVANEICTIDADYLLEHKACTIDADCAALEFRPTCCANTLLVGVNVQSLEEVSTCASKTVRPCVCEATPNRAEDGRAIKPGVETEARCEAGQCRSRVASRNCGNKLHCETNEVCVSYGDAQLDAPEDAGSGDNAYVAYACLPNPCRDALDCKCAQAACDARGIGVRKCEVSRNDESDVACVRNRD